MVNAQNEKTRAAVLGAYQRACDGVAAQLESPIEAAVYWALLALGTEWGHPRVEYDPAGQSWFTISTRLEDVTIVPQRPVSANGHGYRLDFLAETEPGAPGASSGRSSPAFKAAVECDGHDFHERTKEQAARDRKRDRDLQAAGYLILRFTGSEIARDPRAVAEEIVEALNSKAQAAWEEMYAAHLAAEKTPGGGDG